MYLLTVDTTGLTLIGSYDKLVSMYKNYKFIVNTLPSLPIRNFIVYNSVCIINAKLMANYQIRIILWCLTV